MAIKNTCYPLTFFVHCLLLILGVKIVKGCNGLYVKGTPSQISICNHKAIQSSENYLSLSGLLFI